MDPHPSSLANSETVLTEVVPQADRRQSPRENCHTVVTTVTLPDDIHDVSPIILKTQSEDISEGGAKLISLDPLPSRRILLRFLLPTHWDRFLEAEVVSESIREQVSFTKRLIRQHIYRVRFTGVEHDAKEFEHLISTASVSNSGDHDDRE